jgi:hypothetical protein
MESLPGLPKGEPDFVSLREDGCIYVDKTAHIAQMILGGKYYFLSRPRRFGKSLTVSTIDALFSGRRELFSGLEIEKFFDHKKFREGPVLLLDMSEVNAKYLTSTSIEKISDNIENGLSAILAENADRYGVKLRGREAPEMFGNLIADLKMQFGNVAILIDEYDKVLIDSVNQNNLFFNETKDIFRNFFIRIKSKAKHIRFVFITGVTRFSKMGIFSALNNLTDISIDKKYGAMLGYTQKEIVDNFGPYIDRAAKNVANGDRQALLDKVEQYYDGFCFDGETLVYNPYSTLLFFDKEEFDNYWFETGTPSILAEYMKKRFVIVDRFKNINVTRNFVVNPGELDTSKTLSYLYQSGYLSLRKGDLPGDFKLDYPNYEVYQSMSMLMTWNIFGDEDSGDQATVTLRSALRRKDAKNVILNFNALLGKLYYEDYEKAYKADIKKIYPEIEFREWLYRATLLGFAAGTGIPVQPEVAGNLGRADLIVFCDSHTWVMELKVAKTTRGVVRAANDAMKQIVEKQYDQQHPNPIKLGIGIDDGKRRIGGYRLDDEPFQAVGRSG